jgi:Mn-dependent DtxR family transcriptional regulator
MGDIQESGEMYLETILVLSMEKPLVRSIDVAEYMGFSKPSVSRAVGILKAHDYITVEDTGNLKLTKTGKDIAKKIYERHTVLTELLVKLGVDEKTASEDACRIEHVISNKSFKAVKKHTATL